LFSERDIESLSLNKKLSKDKMEKISIELSAPKEKKFELGDQMIVVDPYISLSTRRILIQEYLSIFLNELDDLTERYLKAKNVFMMIVIDLNTNIDISNLGVDAILKNDLWNLLRGHILNLGEIEKELKEVVEYALKEKEMQKSIGYNFDRVSNKISDLLDKVSDTDLSKEGIAELFKKLDFEKDSINEIIDPSKVLPKPRKKTNKNIVQ